MKTLLTNALIVNEGRQYAGSLLIKDECIEGVFQEGDVLPSADKTYNLDGALLMPGVIDDHVHFRDPGLTHKATIESESRAALAGGVTSVMDMPNVVPQTTTIERWKERQQLGAQNSRVNYAYYLGATNDNLDDIQRMDIHQIPAVKLFMGSSTGNMLVDKEEALRNVFRYAPTLVMAHCEDTQRINQRMQMAVDQWGEDPSVEHHAWIRDAEACYQSSLLATQLANEEKAHLHLAHITTEKELSLIGPHVTAEACVAHLLFCDEDYTRLGTRIKCNPAVKSKEDRSALRKALNDGRITLIGTDHAPHLLSEKQGGCRKAASGMPMVQFSLVSMLDMVDEGIITLERMVELMCHAPARLFNIKDRGFLRPGYKADIAIIRQQEWTMGTDDILSLCRWSPLEGHTFHHKVEMTFVNGHLAYDHGHIDDTYRGQTLWFDR